VYVDGGELFDPFRPAPGVFNVESRTTHKIRIAPLECAQEWRVDVTDISTLEQRTVPAILAVHAFVVLGGVVDQSA
jgi:hypothetical protein